VTKGARPTNAHRVHLFYSTLVLLVAVVAYQLGKASNRETLAPVLDGTTPRSGEATARSDNEMLPDTTPAPVVEDERRQRRQPDASMRVSLAPKSDPTPASAVKAAYDVLAECFSRNDYEALYREAARLSIAIQTPQGVDSLLRLFDSEGNQHFISQVLGALAQAEPVDIGDPTARAARRLLDQSLWQRFMSEEGNRISPVYFEYFCSNTRLTKARLPEILKIAKSKRDVLRRRAISALVGLANRPEVLDVLCSTAEPATDTKTRCTALWALRGSSDERALRIMRQSLDDSDESVRATALSVCPVPAEASQRRRFANRLTAEFRTIRAPRNRDQIIDKLLATEPKQLASLLRDELRTEREPRVRDYYEALLGCIEDGMTTPWAIYRRIRSKRDLYRYGR